MLADHTCRIVAGWVLLLLKASQLASGSVKTSIRLTRTSCYALKNADRQAAA